jgi:hypothetical protein
MSATMKTSLKIRQLIAEWEAMISCHVPPPLQPHMSASLYGMQQVLEEVQAMEEAQGGEDEP